MVFPGLYIHVPFCAAKCSYCDFYSLAPTPVCDGAEALVKRLITELEHRTANLTAPVSTVFIGGGTPTVLPSCDLARLLDAASQAARLRPVEFTVEANPESLTPDTAALLARHGVDRVSVGAQSFHEAELEFLGRIHTPDRIATALAAARAGGIDRVNLDLIYGVPGQSPDTWRESLDRAIDLGTGHMSCYALTYEPETPLARRLRGGEFARCDETLEADLYLMALDRLTEAGFEQYEISNFARPGERCRHNMAYWRHEPYLGIGPSASGYLRGERYRNVADIDEYIRRIDERGEAVAERERITGTTLAAEMIMLGLRLTDGLDVVRFRDWTGLDPLSTLARSLEGFAEQKLIHANAERIALTRAGLLVADTVIAELMADLDRAGPMLLPPSSRLPE